MTGERGTIYLLHFDRPYKHAKHYIGWTANLSERLAAHSSGTGDSGRLMAVIKQAGIGFVLARIWTETTRTYERSLKKQGGASRICPICREANK
jgi:predicted GIY-YIG superfamily endonuclease